MSKLCLGTYFAAIKQCKSESYIQKSALRDLFSGILYEYDPNESVIGHIVRGDTNPSKVFIDTINNFDTSKYPEIVECFEPLSNLINPNKIDLLVMLFTTIINEDTSIKDDTVVDLVNQTKKSEMPGSFDSLSSILAGIFIYTVKYTNNNNTQDYVKEIDNQFVATVMNQLNQPNTNIDDFIDIFDNNLTNDYKARILTTNEFLLEYENTLKLVPLCQIAYIFNPHHKHNRQMFTEYNLLSYEKRIAVLEYCKCRSLMSISLLMFDSYFDCFLKDLEKLELIDRRFCYVFKQYFYRSIDNHANKSSNNYNKNTFDRLLINPIIQVFPTSQTSTLEQYISDYLWYKNNKIAVTIERPFDYLWNHKNLATRPEEDLTFWICRFIVDVCKNLMNWNSNTIFVDDTSIETQEDMFYYTLLYLHNNYYNINNHS